LDEYKEDEIELPEENELVVATVREIHRHGAYLDLDDYGIEGYLPIGEVSSRWVRNIYDVLKVGQKVVARVIRIDYRHKTVDLSLKRVSKQERERFFRLWKRDQRGIQIIEEMIRDLNLDEEEIEDKLAPLLQKEQTVYDALEKIVIEPKILDELNVPKKDKILEFLTKRIKPKKYVYETRLKLFYIGKNGVKQIRDACTVLIKSIQENADDLEELRIFNDGTPHYRLVAKSYKPEVIRRAVIPTVKNIVKKLSKKVNIEIVSEETSVEV